MLLRLDLKNCSFVVTRPTQLWKCRLQIFYWTSKSKAFFFELKTISKVNDYFNVKFYISNACLNFIEQVYHFPQQNIKRTYAWFQVSKCFVFSLSPLAKHFGICICSLFKDENIYKHIFMNMFQTLYIVLALKFSHSNVYYF